ncbi:MAG: LuxR C-terminal-related transcriptional regulator [Bacteroidota bacterium]|nr:LuxR C-terminal-related transcriptional regulator [Bacteroidota bacterium]
MPSVKAVILYPNYLIMLGLKTLLKDLFSVNVIFASAELDKSGEETLSDGEFDLCFISKEWFEAQGKRLKKKLTPKSVLLIETKSVTERTENTLQIDLSSEEILAAIRENLATLSPQNSNSSGPGLSEREIEVLKLVTKGHLNKEIADILNISIHTVIAHRRNITSRLGIKTVSGLTVYAILNGITSSGLHR